MFFAALRSLQQGCNTHARTHALTRTSYLLVRAQEQARALTHVAFSLSAACAHLQSKVARRGENVSPTADLQLAFPPPSPFRSSPFSDRRFLAQARLFVLNRRVQGH